MPRWMSPMTSTVKVRNESPSDAAIVYDVIRAAFGREDEARLVQTLHKNGNSAVAVMGVLDDKVVAHCVLAKLVSPKDCLGLGPVSVLPEYQNQGIGKRIIGKTLRQAQASGWNGVFVLGDPDYYERFGFSYEMASTFPAPFPREYFMAKELRPDSLRGRCEPVEYPPAYHELS